MINRIATPKIILIILDGFGYSEIKKGNAVEQAKKPTFDFFWNNYPHTLLQSFGKNVGLPWGAISSSEVGHVTIGSGKMVIQEYSFIEEQINNQSFFTNPKIIKLINKTASSGRPLHLVGLLSDGGTHSHINHLFAILDLLKLQKFNNEVFIHVISDGRDSDQKSLEKYIYQLEYKIKTCEVDAKIVSIVGRYYAMDRDNNWDRVFKAYQMMTSGIGEKTTDLSKTIKESYKNNITDEFILPIVVDLPPQKKGWLGNLFKKSDQKLRGNIQKGDSVLFFNIRADRMRQLVEMFLYNKPEAGSKAIKKLQIATLTTYDDRLPVTVLYPTKKTKNPLAKILSDHNLSQGHFAETEKYAHVTYFFNGGNSNPFKREQWYLTDSPKVNTFDLMPEMSAGKITDSVIEASKKKDLDFILINFANADMVGHTGKLEPTIRAVEAIDGQLKRIYEAFPDSTILITADHGNAEYMINIDDNSIQTGHSSNPVPFILINKKQSDGLPCKLRLTGDLTDVAPTVLALFGIARPDTMTGTCLITKEK